LSDADADGQRGQNGPISGSGSDDVSDRKPILQPYSSYGGVVTGSREVVGDTTAATAAAATTTTTTPSKQAATKSPSRTRTTSTSAVAQSDDEVVTHFTRT